MSTTIVLNHIFRSLFYILLQILIVRYLIFFNVGFCFVYVAIIISLPKETGPVNALFIGFLVGLIVDAFYNTMGLHTAACVLIAYLRPGLLGLLVSQQKGADEYKDYSLQSLTLPTFLAYAGTLIVIHAFMVFYLELNSTQIFWTTLLKIIVSSIITLLVVVLFQLFRR
jgi:hypothetical protein